MDKSKQHFLDIGYELAGKIGKLEYLCRYNEEDNEVVYVQSLNDEVITNPRALTVSEINILSKFINK